MRNGMAFKSSLKTVAALGMLLSITSLAAHFFAARYYTWASSGFDQQQQQQQQIVQPAAILATSGFVHAEIRGDFHDIRSSICDLIVVAKLLNVTLVIPKLREVVTKQISLEDSTTCSTSSTSSRLSQTMCRSSPGFRSHCGSVPRSRATWLCRARLRSSFTYRMFFPRFKEMELSACRSPAAVVSSVNVFEGPLEERVMTTGIHTVADIYCKGCQQNVGWKYEAAQHKSQKYKEGKFILERSRVVGCERGDFYLDTQAIGSDPDDVPLE